MKYRIMGRDYKLTRMTRKEAVKYAGKISNHEQAIVVDVECAPQYVEDTVMHEALHAMDFHLNLGLSEHKIKLLETGLASFLRDNGVSLKPLRPHARDKS